MLKQRNRVLYLQMNRMDSVAVRSMLYRELYRKKGYRVVYRSWDTFAIILFLEGFCPPVAKKLFNVVSQFLLQIYQYLILHFEVRFYDGIVIMKYFPYETVSLIRKNTKAKLLYDFDDAIWLDMNMPLLKDYDKTIRLVDFVSVDNRYLYDKAVKYNKNVFILPPPAQFEKLTDHWSDVKKDVITIGWIGSMGTSYYLYSLHSVLETLGRKYENIKLLVLGFALPKLPFFESIKSEVIQEYDTEKMNRARSRIDIGVFPLLPCENSLGRGLCKPVIYMGASIPVVATNLGIISDLIQDGKNGFLCNNDHEWIEALSKLIEDKSLRREIGHAGFATVKAYSLENIFKILEDNFLCHL